MRQSYTVYDASGHPGVPGRHWWQPSAEDDNAFLKSRRRKEWSHQASTFLDSLFAVGTKLPGLTACPARAPPPQSCPADSGVFPATNKTRLTKIRSQKAFITELGGMLVIYKGNVVLKVALDEGAVRIQPVVGRFDNPQLLNALARNEELLAQVYFTHQKIADLHTAMAHYFEQRGWLARMPGQAPPEKETGAWAES